MGSFIFDCMGGKGIPPDWLRTADLKLIVLAMAEQIKTLSKEPAAESKSVSRPGGLTPK